MAYNGTGLVILGTSFEMVGFLHEVVLPILTKKPAARVGLRRINGPTYKLIFVFYRPKRNEDKWCQQVKAFSNTLLNQPYTQPRRYSQGTCNYSRYYTDYNASS